MDWSPGFPDVTVEADTNAIMVGHRHRYSRLAENNKAFFDLTGQQDIVTMLHYSRNRGAPSRLSLVFDKPASHFLFIVYGMRTNAEMKILTFDSLNKPIFLSDWETLLRGDLVPSTFNQTDGIEKTFSVIPSSIDRLTLGYMVMKSSANISRIDMVFVEHCQERSCIESPMFYSLLAIGNCHPFSLSGTLYVDLDGNDFRSDNEPVYPKVFIQLFTSKGVFVAATMSSMEGFYEFNHLAPETYNINVHLPLGVRVAPSRAFSSEGISSNIELIPTAPNLMGNGDGTFIYLGQTAPGLIPVAFAVSGTVCYDVNVNGIQDMDETGEIDVDVDLFKSGSDEFVETSRTDDTGYYIFDNLQPGNYYIHINLPEGMRITHGPESQLVNQEGILPPFNLDHNTPGLVIVTPGSTKASMMSANNNICFTDQLNRQKFEKTKIFVFKATKTSHLTDLSSTKPIFPHWTRIGSTQPPNAQSILDILTHHDAKQFIKTCIENGMPLKEMDKGRVYHIFKGPGISNLYRTRLSHGE
eukprot:gene8054-9464_t